MCNVTMATACSILSVEHRSEQTVPQWLGSA